MGKLSEFETVITRSKLRVVGGKAWFVEEEIPGYSLGLEHEPDSSVAKQVHDEAQQLANERGVPVVEVGRKCRHLSNRYEPDR